MLGVPGGAVLIKTLFRLGDAVSGAFPHRSKERQVIFGMERIWKNHPLSTNTLVQGNRPCRHVRLGIDVDIQTAGGLAKVAYNDRFGGANHAVEPDLIAFRQPALRVRNIAGQRRSFLQHEVSEPDRARAVGDGRFHRYTHDTLFLLFVYDLCQSDEYGFSHQAPTSFRRDDLPIPWQQNPAEAEGLLHKLCRSSW